MSNVVSLRAGENAAALRSKSDRAKQALASPHPTLEQARDLTEALRSSWSAHLFTDARLDGIAEMLMHFPLDVGTRCADRWNGIASTKIPDLRTGKLQPRRYPPSDGEIRDWCENYVADMWSLAKAAEIAERPRESSAPTENPRPPPTPEDLARVWACVAEVRAGRDRVMGQPTEEERRDRSIAALEKAAREAGQTEGAAE